jgi:protein-tyrosine phosphatase
MPHFAPSLLFVCLGNICRSPAAEGVAHKLLLASGKSARIDSAGLGPWHAGEPPHRTMRKVAAERGYPIDHLRARQVRPSDFDEFDSIYCMDSENLRALQDLQKQYGGKAQIARLCGDRDVPDPYYGGLDGFYKCFDMILAGVQKLAVSFF